MDDILESEDFNNLMQTYRWSSINADTIAAFEAVKDFIRENIGSIAIVVPGTVDTAGIKDEAL